MIIESITRKLTVTERERVRESEYSLSTSKVHSTIRGHKYTNETHFPTTETITAQPHSHSSNRINIHHTHITLTSHTLNPLSPACRPWRRRRGWCREQRLGSDTRCGAPPRERRGRRGCRAGPRTHPVREGSRSGNERVERKMVCVVRRKSNRYFRAVLQR